jgi:hypothetical protein
MENSKVGWAWRGYGANETGGWNEDGLSAPEWLTDAGGRRIDKRLSERFGQTSNFTRALPDSGSVPANFRLSGNARRNSTIAQFPVQAGDVLPLRAGGAQQDDLPGAAGFQRTGGETVGSGRRLRCGRAAFSAAGFSSCVASICSVASSNAPLAS